MWLSARWFQSCRSHKFVMGSPENKVSLAEQFILRLPLNEARNIRDMIQQNPGELNKHLKISLNVDNNQVKLNTPGATLHGTLKKLPTMIESYKSTVSNKSTLLKVADVSHIVECSYEEKAETDSNTSHGYCPPLKNVKKRRFRKTKSKKNDDLTNETVSKELKHLFRADSEAISTRFEILYEQNPGPSSAR